MLVKREEGKRKRKEKGMKRHIDKAGRKKWFNSTPPPTLGRSLGEGRRNSIQVLD